MKVFSKEPHASLIPVPDRPGLPRVLLIGDSISMGYTLDVRRRLDGTANVHRVPANAESTWTGLERIDDWLGDGRWDVIHFNWGLWDLAWRAVDDPVAPGRLDKESGKLTSTPEQYAANLRRLVERMRMTGARLIFATTTPVPEGEPGRRTGDERVYNEAAVEVMREYAVTVNDLHAHARIKITDLTNPVPWLVAPGDVHFSSDGYAWLAERVADAIRTELDAEKKVARHEH